MMRARTISILLCTVVASTALAAPDDDSSGAQLYGRYCASCHGVVGEGDGPAASIMQIHVPNLRTLSVSNGGVFPLAAVLAYVDGRKVPASHGNRIMPIWGQVFAWGDSDEDAQKRARARINAIVEFVEKLQYH